MGEKEIPNRRRWRRNVEGGSSRLGRNKTGGRIDPVKRMS